MALLTIFLVNYILISISLFFLFPKANVPGWKGLVPVLNFMEWCKLVGRPTYYAFLIFIPIVGFFIYAGLCVDMVRSFGKFKFWDSFIAVALTPLSFFPLAFSKSEYQGPILIEEKEYFNNLKEAHNNGDKLAIKKLQKQRKFNKSWGREWAEAIIFAVFAAAFIRMFLIEAYVIPTPSMEGSLLVGDFLFVSKAHYGIRTPQTVAMLPLLHNRVPIVGGESYFEKPSLPYYRTKALETIDRNDPIVFNWPVGDSVYVTKQRPYSVAQVTRDPSFAARDAELKRLIAKKEIITRPIDKRDHYIKRCVAVAGDSLSVRNGQLFINGEKVKNPQHMQYRYEVDFSKSIIGSKSLEKIGIEKEDRPANHIIFLTLEQEAQLREMDPSLPLKRYTAKWTSAGTYQNFPHDPKNFNKWTIDNYGPIWIPKAGETVNIGPSNIALYRRIIGVYENNDLVEKNGKIIINGKEETSYTFKQDYYWAMGDNRHNSEDSRSWGFVPHDHIVGKPLFIWFSTKDGSIFNGIRWSRIFSGADKF